MKQQVKLIGGRRTKRMMFLAFSLSSPFLLWRCTETPTAKPDATEARTTDIKDTKSTFENKVTIGSGVDTSEGGSESPLAAGDSAIAVMGTEAPETSVDKVVYLTNVAPKIAVRTAKFEVTQDSISVVETFPSAVAPAVVAAAPSTAEAPPLTIAFALAPADEVLMKSLDLKCSTTDTATGLKPNTSYVAATCAEGKVLSDYMQVMTLANPVEIQEFKTEPTGNAKIVLDLSGSGWGDIAIAIKTAAGRRWINLADGTFVEGRKPFWNVVSDKDTSLTIVIRIDPTVETVAQTWTKNKKHFRSRKSLPFLASGEKVGSENLLIVHQIIETVEAAADLAIAAEVADTIADAEKPAKTKKENLADLKKELRALKGRADSNKIALKKLKKEQRALAKEKDATKDGTKKAESDKDVDVETAKLKLAEQEVASKAADAAIEKNKESKEAATLLVQSKTEEVLKLKDVTKKSESATEDLVKTAANVDKEKVAASAAEEKNEDSGNKDKKTEKAPSSSKK